jgi:hypothetical protein
MIVAWTGHRPDVFADPAVARAVVESTARELAEQGARRFLVGGQRGVDTWAALAAIACGIPFSLVLPFAVDDFTRDWLEADRCVLVHTLAHAETVQVAGGYTERNRILASEADLLVAVWTRTSGGGTAETIALATRAATPLREIILDPSPTAATAAHSRGI